MSTHKEKQFAFSREETIWNPVVSECSAIRTQPTATHSTPTVLPAYRALPTPGQVAFSVWQVTSSYKTSKRTPVLIVTGYACGTSYFPYAFPKTSSISQR